MEQTSMHLPSYQRFRLVIHEDNGLRRFQIVDFATGEVVLDTPSRQHCEHELARMNTLYAPLEVAV